MPQEKSEKSAETQNQRVTVSVIGGHDIDDRVRALAEQVGQMIAEAGAVLVCGGLGGSMEAAAKGCRAAGGLTIGLLPGTRKEDANPYIEIALPTTIGFARNAMVACSADIIVALPGSHGTSSEISYGLVYKKPIIDLGGWNRDGMISVNGVEGARKKLKEMVASAR